MNPVNFTSDADGYLRDGESILSITLPVAPSNEALTSARAALSADGTGQKAGKQSPPLKRPAVQVDWAENEAPEEEPQNNRVPDAVEKTKTAPEPAKGKPPKEYARNLPGGTVLDDADIEILEPLNESYTHTVLGGKNIIVGQRTCQVQGSVFTFEAPAEFKKKFLHMRLIGVGDKKKNQGQAWLEWPDKNYKPNGTGFYPDPKKMP